MELKKDIDLIIEKLAILSTEIKLRGKFNLLDIHVDAEPFFAELMNLIFGYHLKNINLIEQNAKAIDLIDIEHKIIVQVSSDNSKGKVQSSLSGIKEEYKKESYHFIFISISEEITNLKKQSFEIPKGIVFDPKNDCLDNKTLIIHIESRGTECIKKVSEFLNKTILYTECNSTAPDFNFYPIQNLIPRDTTVDNLHNLVNKNQFTNLCGLGGSGKTSLVNLFVTKYASEYNQIAYIVVNNNIKDDFISQINETIHLFKPEDNSVERINKIEELANIAKLATKEQIQDIDKNKDKFKTIIYYLEFNYKSNKSNLLIIDINNAQQEETAIFGNNLVNLTLSSNKIYPYGWKYIIISRENIYSGIEELNLNGKEDENNAFLRELLLDNAGQENYKSFSDHDFAELFKKIFYSPLITEQLGRFLRNKEPYSLQEIFALLDKDRFKNKERVGITSQNRHNEEEKTIIGFLRNIVVLDNFSEDEQKLLRHFILWPTDYIPRNVVAGLLEGLFQSEDDFDEALDNLIERKIISCQKNNNVREYKLHGLVAKSLRYQIEVSDKNYTEYLNNIQKIINFPNGTYIPYSNYIGYSLSEFNLAEDNQVFYGIVIELEQYISYNYRISLLNKLINRYKHSAEIYPDSTNKYDKKMLLWTYKRNAIIAEHNHNIESEFESYKKIRILKRDEFSISESEKKYHEGGILYDEAYKYYELKDFLKAKEYYIEAINIYESLPKDNYEYQNNLAFVYNNFAILLQLELQDYSSAKDIYVKAIDIRNRFPQNNLEYRNSLAISYNNIAHIQHHHLGDFLAAKDNYNRAIDILIKIPHSPKYQNSLAMSYNNLAYLQKDYLNDFVSAQYNYNIAIKIRDKLPKDNTKYLSGLADSYNGLASLFSEKIHDYYSAQDNYVKAIEILEILPKEIEWQKSLANLYYNLANIQCKHLQDYTSANDNYNKAINIQTKLPKDNQEYQNSLAASYNNLATLQNNHLNDFPSAQDNYNNSIEIREKLSKDNIEYQYWLSLSYHNLANIQNEKFHNYNSAQENYTKAIDIRKKLPKDNEEYQNNLAISYKNLANLQNIQLHDYISAQKNYNRAIEIREKLSKDNLYYQDDLAGLYTNLANTQFRQPDGFSLAQKNYNKALEIREKLPKDNSKYQNSLAILYTNIAILHKTRFNDYLTAEKYYIKAIDIQKSIPNANTEFTNALASSYNGLAYCYVKHNNYDDAIKSITTAIEIAANMKDKDSKYLTEWLNYRHSLAEIQFFYGVDLEDAKNSMLELQPLVQKRLHENPNDNLTKKVHNDINELLSKL